MRLEQRALCETSWLRLRCSSVDSTVSGLRSLATTVMLARTCSLGDDIVCLIVHDCRLYFQDCGLDYSVALNSRHVVETIDRRVRLPPSYSTNHQSKARDIHTFLVVISCSASKDPVHIHNVRSTIGNRQGKQLEHLRQSKSQYAKLRRGRRSITIT